MLLYDYNMSTEAAPSSDVAAHRVAVFGASGAVGRHVVERALGRGHEVIAYVRSPGKLTVSDPKLTVIVGELSDRDAVRAAVRGADSVISALGPSLDRKATGMPLIDGLRNIVYAMRAEAVRRFIGMATPSLRDPRDRRSTLGIVVPVMGRVLFPRAYRELLAMSQVVIDSDLDWTIARFIRPTNGAATGTVRAGFLGRDKVGSAITRADIAAFLVDQLNDTRFRRTAPAISN